VLSFKSRGVQEEELAFLRGDMVKSVKAAEDSRFIVEKEDSLPFVSESTVTHTAPPDEGELINFDDIFSSAAVEPSAVTKIGKKKRGRQSDADAVAADVLGDVSADMNKKKDTKVEETVKVKDKKATVAAPVSASVSVPLGLSLKQQLEKFKQKVASGDKTSIITVQNSKMSSADDEDDDDAVNEDKTVAASVMITDIVEVEQKVYVPVPTVDPIGPDGRVLKPILSEEELKEIKEGTEDDSKKWRVMSSHRKNRICLNRDPKIQASRLNLPVCGMEQEIVEAITLNDVVILCGETGSGKSTQVPQFLFEAGYGESGMIGITQPRRVAATSTAERVGVEMGEPIKTGVRSSKAGVQSALKKKQKKSKNSKNSAGEAEEVVAAEVAEDENVKQGGLVGYQIRFDASTVGKKTMIKFMTDGILLREVTSDLLLRQYSVILLDEAHERNVNTDILLGMISR
jgi:HrpA-like RNA helicase